MSPTKKSGKLAICGQTLVSCRMKTKKNTYTCNEYRTEMILLGLNKRLHQGNLSEEEKQKIRNEIKKLELEMGMD